MINKHQLLSYYNKIWLPFMNENKLPEQLDINGNKIYTLKIANDYYINAHYNNLSWLLTVYFYEPGKKNIDIHIWNWNWGWKYNTDDMKKTGLLDLYDYLEQDYTAVFHFLKNIKFQIKKNKLINS